MYLILIVHYRISLKHWKHYYICLSWHNLTQLYGMIRDEHGNLTKWDFFWSLFQCNIIFISLFLPNINVPPSSDRVFHDAFWKLQNQSYQPVSARSKMLWRAEYCQSHFWGLSSHVKKCLPDANIVHGSMFRCCGPKTSERCSWSGNSFEKSMRAVF